MIRKWLPYILILLTILSGVSVAYAHQSHPTETEHAAFHNSHELSSVAQRSESGESDKLPVDEHSYHLCHHFTCILLLGTHDRVEVVLSGQKLFEYGLRLPSALTSPHLRPPIL